MSRPWRDLPNKEENLKFLKRYQTDEANRLRILLHGPTGAGKSSFINSVDTVLQERTAGRALADANSQESFTKIYKTYKIQKGGPGTFYPFGFSDTLGFEKDNKKGVGVEDMKLAMNGHIRDGYNFNPLSGISKDDQKYNSSPTLKDKVHVLVCVIPASSVDLLSNELMKKMRDVRLAASELGIPQVAILTKIDVACPEVEEDLRNVYKSKSLKTKMEELSVGLGIPLNCIFPVKNYHSEININDDIDVLILSAMRHIINHGEDFVNGL